MLTLKRQGWEAMEHTLKAVGAGLPNVLWYAQVNAAERATAALQGELRRVFDRPTPLIQNGLRLRRQRAQGVITIGWKDVFGQNEPNVEHRGQLYADAVSRTLIPHIDGTPRVAKPSERQLRAAGILAGNEFLVPSRTAPVDRYGNIRGATMSKMLSDLGSYSRAGAPGTTGAAKRQYVFGSVGATQGIFRVGKDLGQGRWRLVFLVVSGAPRYRARFRFYAVGAQAFDAALPAEFERTLTRALRGRSR